MKMVAIIALVMSQCLFGADKKVDSTWSHRKVAPTWLHRFVPDISGKTVEISTESCHYKPIFGEGDAGARYVQSIARFSEVEIDPKGACKKVSYPHEEQIYFILDGAGIIDYSGTKTSVKKDDFTYIAPGMEHEIFTNSTKPCRLIVMGFKIPPGRSVAASPKLPLANLNDVKEQTDAGHPTSVLYRLLLGNKQGTNDKIESGITVTSLFMMDFAPGGTNFPHRHEIAEEIYLVLDGRGQMVADGGTDGVEGLHPAKAGDAYFFRPNCTVGFYNSRAGKAHILAVRSWVQLPQRDYQN